MKTDPKIEKFLEKCLDELMKVRTGGLFRSLAGGMKDVLMFTSLRNVIVRKRKWKLNISPTLTVTCDFMQFTLHRRFAPLLGLLSCDEQQYSTVDLLFEIIGSLNNVFLTYLYFL